MVCGSDLIYYTYSEETPHSRLLLEALGQLCDQDTPVFLSLSLHHNPEEVRSRARARENAQACGSDALARATTARKEVKAHAGCRSRRARP